MPLAESGPPPNPETLDGTELAVHATLSFGTKGAALAIIPVAFFVHNAEEALMIGRMLPRMSRLAARALGPDVVLPSSTEYGVALLVLTLVGFALYGVARYWHPGVYVLLVLQATMSVNVVTHTLAAVALGGYAPGLLSAWLLEAPASWYVFRRARRAAWMTTRQTWMLLPLAVTLHLVLGALVLVRGI